MGKAKAGKNGLWSAGLGFLAGGVAAGSAVLSRQPGRVANMKRTIKRSGHEWHAVTVDKPREEVIGDGTPPPPLAVHRNALGFRVKSSPDGRRTEIRAHLRDGASLETPDGTPPDEVIKTALQDTKALLEESSTADSEADTKA